MSSETALTARMAYFTVSGTRVARGTQWQVNPKLAHKSEWGDSDSAGHTNRAGGRLDCTFSVEGKFDTDSEQYNLFEPGDILAVELYMSATLAWSFPRALCDDFKLMVNIDTEEVIGWTSDWGEDGASTNPSGVVPQRVGEPDS